MPRRYCKTYPIVHKRRINYAVLFNNKEDKAQMAYNRDMAFRRFVSEWNADVPELMAWSLADFYKAYLSGGAQLSLTLF